MIQESTDKGILKFADKPMAVDTNPFPEVSANMVIPNLSRLSRPWKNINIWQPSHTSKDKSKDNKYGNAPTRAIHDLKWSHEDEQKVESAQQANPSTKSDLSKKTTDELIDEIR